MKLLRNILIALCMAWALYLIGGCVNKVYDRETFDIDPNGAIHYERIHLDITGVATDTKFDSLEVESGSRKVVIKKAVEKQDSIKITVPPYFIGETTE